MQDTRKTILFLNFNRDEPMYHRQLDGIRRCAKQFDWTVETCSCAEAGPRDIPALISRLKPIGCIDACALWRPCLPKEIFGRVPVCHIDPPVGAPYRSALLVKCDNTAIAREAFRELSLGLPPTCAVVPFAAPRRWSAERTAAFRAHCRENGIPCSTFPCRAVETKATRAARMATWAAALPDRCAVFAVNDPTAREMAAAFRAAGRAVPASATLVGADCLEEAGIGKSAITISSVRIDFEHAGYLAAKMLAGKTPCATFGPLLVERRESTGGRGRREPHVMDAIDIIRREASDGLTAADVASRLPGSRNLLERRFREATGHSVFEEILQTRLQNAVSLLMRPELPIAAVADYSGFPSGNEFHRIFRARLEMSPGQWRKSHIR